MKQCARVLPSSPRERAKDSTKESNDGHGDGSAPFVTPSTAAAAPAPAGGEGPQSGGEDSPSDVHAAAEVASTSLSGCGSSPNESNTASLGTFTTSEYR